MTCVHLRDCMHADLTSHPKLMRGEIPNPLRTINVHVYIWLVRRDWGTIDYSEAVMCCELEPSIVRIFHLLIH